MGGLFKPGESDLASTANYLASKVGGAINGTYDLPGMITRGFTLPSYQGNVGVGTTQTQRDLLGLSNSLLGRYFGGGYAAPVGGAPVYTPPTGGGPGNPGPGPSYPPPPPSQIRNPNGSPGDAVGQPVDRYPWQIFNPGLLSMSGANKPKISGSDLANLSISPSDLSAFGLGPGDIPGTTPTPAPAIQRFNPATFNRWLLGDANHPWDATTMGGYGSATNGAGVPNYDFLNYGEYPTAKFGDIDPSTFAGMTDEARNALAQQMYDAYGKYAVMMQGYDKSLINGPAGTSYNWSSGGDTAMGPEDRAKFMALTGGAYTPNAYASPGDMSPSGNGVPVFVPGFDPAKAGAGPYGPNYGANNGNGGIGDIGLPGLGSMSLPFQTPGAYGADSLLSRFLANPSNPGSFDPTIMSMINNPGISSLLDLAQGGGVGGSALNSLLAGPGSQFGQIANSLNTQRLNNLRNTNRDIREQMSVSGLRGSTNYADALQTAATDSEGNMMAELARIIPTITGQDIQSKEAGLGALTTAGAGAGTAGSAGANTLASLFQSTAGNNLQQLLASPTALSSLLQLPYQLQGAQQGLAASDLGLLGSVYGLNEQARTTADTNAVRQYQEFQRTQQLFPQLLSFLSGTPMQPQQSPFSQATGAAGDIGALAIGAKALKSMK